VVFVTHDVEEAMLLGDRICIMRQGKVVQIGTPEEIVLKPCDDFVESFFGAEGALKLLSRYRAADYADDMPSEGSPLEADSSLKEALASMILEGRERVPIGDGSIALSSILDALRRQES
jgi:osmoprotectant transport system ATP-binding protein